MSDVMHFKIPFHSVTSVNGKSNSLRQSVHTLILREDGSKSKVGFITMKGANLDNKEKKGCTRAPIHRLWQQNSMTSTIGLAAQEETLLQSWVGNVCANAVMSSLV